MASIGCPYGAKDCPKVEDVSKSLDRVATTLSKLTRIVYILCGICLCQMGVVIW